MNYLLDPFSTTYMLHFPHTFWPYAPVITDCNYCPEPILPFTSHHYAHHAHCTFVLTSALSDFFLSMHSFSCHASPPAFPRRNPFTPFQYLVPQTGPISHTQVIASPGPVLVTWPRPHWVHPGKLIWCRPCRFCPVDVVTALLMWTQPCTWPWWCDLSPIDVIFGPVDVTLFLLMWLQALSMWSLVLSMWSRPCRCGHGPIDVTSALLMWLQHCRCNLWFCWCDPGLVPGSGDVTPALSTWPRSCWCDPGLALGPGDETSVPSGGSARSDLRYAPVRYQGLTLKGDRNCTYRWWIKDGRDWFSFERRRWHICRERLGKYGNVMYA